MKIQQSMCYKNKCISRMAEYIDDGVLDESDLKALVQMILFKD